MNKLIPAPKPTQMIIRDTSEVLPRIDPNEVAAELGTERASERRKKTLSPVTLLAVREELANRLQSSGGRSGEE